MKQLLMSAACVVILAACNGENSYERHSKTDEMSDSAAGFQTGSGTESNPIAAPNAANTIRTPVPLDTVTVESSDTSRKH